MNNMKAEGSSMSRLILENFSNHENPFTFIISEHLSQSHLWKWRMQRPWKLLVTYVYEHVS